MPRNSAHLITRTRIKTITEGGRIAWVFPEGLHIPPNPSSGTYQVPVMNCRCHQLSLCKGALGKHYIKVYAPTKQVPSMDLKQWT